MIERNLQVPVYKSYQAQSNEVKGFTGVDNPYEKSNDTDIVV
ncbi:5544_t:CDS:2 [Entrophospora sp. SA101]|nr:5544_t:CDS:2 [Entrophospora sp. SA101]CAJ0839094.1 15126_t:CDS:2 [Entrophospora sp. SA101]